MTTPLRSRLGAAPLRPSGPPVGLEDRFRPNAHRATPHAVALGVLEGLPWWAQRHPERVLVQVQLHLLSEIGEPPQTPFLPRATLTA
ncbi:hypothetical protein NLX62_04240, partial [Mycobacteriaceae bacterium Msp059]|nr:hypothetical protein [Mycobacteriaceae bacterium Msp059]